MAQIIRLANGQLVGVGGGYEPLPVQLSGSRVGVGTATTVSLVDDGNGNGVLRVVDAAPFAYDALTERLKVQQKRVMAIESLDNTLDVASAGTHTVEVRAAEGEIWRVKLLGMNISAPSGAASGTHKVELFLGPSVNVTEYMLMQAVSSYASAIRFRMNTLHLADSSKTPSDNPTQIAVLMNTVITNNVPLLIHYTNSTNVTKTGIWTLRLIVEKETVDA